MEKYTSLASEDTLNATIKSLSDHGYESVAVDNSEQALAKIKEFIPSGASVTNGASTTLEQIGYVEYLRSGEHGWKNLKAGIVAEKDPAKQSLLRKQSMSSEYYLGSVHALTEAGEIVIGSNSGSQIPSVAYGSQNLIFVVGTHKIVKNMDEALDRLRNYVVGLEDKRMKATGAPGTNLSKLLIMYADPAFLGRKIRFIFVKQPLGF